MPYQILPNIIFLLAVFGALLLILRRLPEAAENGPERPATPEDKLEAKGLPALAASKARAWIWHWLRRFWNFVLEAKDLRPSAAAGYRIKKLFGRRPAATQNSFAKPVTQASKAKTEQEYLAAIKNDPKQLSGYDALGKYYLEKGAVEDARDIYEYLVKHDSGSADFHARLAFCHYQLKDLGKTAEHYQKSLRLDSSQPNRYYNLGLVFLALGKETEAADAFERAVALEPGNHKFFLSLSNAYAKAGQEEKARQALGRAQALEKTAAQR